MLLCQCVDRLARERASRFFAENPTERKLDMHLPYTQHHRAFAIAYMEDKLLQAVFRNFISARTEPAAAARNVFAEDVFPYIAVGDGDTRCGMRFPKVKKHESGERGILGQDFVRPRWNEMVRDARAGKWGAGAKVVELHHYTERKIVVLISVVVAMREGRMRALSSVVQHGEYLKPCMWCFRLIACRCRTQLGLC